MKWEMVEDNLRGDQVVPLVQAALECVGLADERSELQVLVRQFGEFDAPIARLGLLTERRHLDRAEGVNAALKPHAIESSEPCAEVRPAVIRSQSESGDGQTSSPLPVRLLLIGYKPGSAVSPSRIVAGRPITKKHYEIVVDEKSGFRLDEQIPLGLEQYRVVGLMRGMPSPSGDPIAFLSLADAQVVQFQLDNDAIRGNRERVKRSYEQFNNVNPLLRTRATAVALSAAENPHFANAILVDLDTPSADADVAASIRRWNHYQVYTAEAERAILLKGFIEKSQKQLWLFRAI